MYGIKLTFKVLSRIVPTFVASERTAVDNSSKSFFTASYTEADYKENLFKKLLKI